MNLRNLKILLFTVYCLLFTFLSGCSSLQQKERVLAVVDGEPITEGDLEYSLTVIHRRGDLSSAGDLTLSEYVQELVNDRLIIDEARRSEMDQYPEIKRAIEAYILRESVVRLHNEEIVQKVSITEQEVLNFYKENFERFTLGLIEVAAEEVAEEIVNKLKHGEDFEEIAQQYSIHFPRNKGGKIIYKRNVVPTYFMEAIAHLQPGEFSDIVNVLNKYYIMKYFGKEEAPGGEEFEKYRSNIEKAIRKQKENERSDEYLNYLRQKASVRVNKELLNAIQLDGGIGEREKWAEDTSHLVEIDSTILTVGDFVSIARPSTRKSKEDILNSLIDRELVDLEALSRHYEREPVLKRMIYRYENQLLKDVFIKRIVIPQIDITDKMVKEYYSNHQERFVMPALYNLQQITVKDVEEAQMILSNLQSGADFSWWAKRKSIDSAASKGGNAGWLIKSVLPESVREIIDTLHPGDITPILEVNSNYMIIRLIEKTEEEVKQYEEVKNAVYRACFNEQIKTILNEYVNKLKDDADIKFYDEQIQSLEEKFLM